MAFSLVVTVTRLGAKVMAIPITSRKPEMLCAGRYLPRRPMRPSSTRMPITSMKTMPQITGQGAPAVPEMMASIGGPPKMALGMSARELMMERWSKFCVVAAMLAVMPPKEMLAPMLSIIRLSAPRMTERLIVGLMTLKSLQYSFFQKRHSALTSGASRPGSTRVERSTRRFCNSRKSAVETTTEMKMVQTTLLASLRKMA